MNHLPFTYTEDEFEALIRLFKGLKRRTHHFATGTSFDIDEDLACELHDESIYNEFYSAEEYEKDEINNSSFWVRIYVNNDFKSIEKEIQIEYLKNFVLGKISLADFRKKFPEGNNYGIRLFKKIEDGKVNHSLILENYKKTDNRE